LCLATYAVCVLQTDTYNFNTARYSLDSASMLSETLTSSDRAAVASALKNGPQLPGEVPRVITILVNWVTLIVNALLAYVTNVMGTNTDQIHNLQDRLDAIEQQDADNESSPAPTTPHPPVQPSCGPVRASRCQRCHATGHDTTNCRTRDPVATKKRIANNQKIKKAANIPIPPSPYPGFVQPHSYFYQPPPPSSYPAIAALAVDAQELRRRKAQSTRDKRRKAAVPSASTIPGPV